MLPVALAYGLGDVLTSSLGPECFRSEEQDFVPRPLKGYPSPIAGHQQELQTPVPLSTTVVPLASEAPVFTFLRDP